MDAMRPFSPRLIFSAEKKSKWKKNIVAATAMPRLLVLIECSRKNANAMEQHSQQQECIN